MENILKQLLNNAYAPYSNFKVAAIIKMKDGNFFKGVNVENASYGATICAERNAINSAIANGYKKNDFDTLYVMNSSENLSTPCFLCRQVIKEFMEDENEVIVFNNKNEQKTFKVSVLCPHPFDKDDLK